MKKNKSKKNKKDLLDIYRSDNLKREKGQRWIDVDVNFKIKMLSKFKNKYINYKKGLVSDNVILNDCDGDIWEEYERSLIVDDINIKINNIISDYDIFSTDSNNAKLYVKFENYIDKSDVIVFKIVKNKNLKDSDLIALKKVIDEESELGNFDYNLIYNFAKKEIYVKLGKNDKNELLETDVLQDLQNVIVGKNVEGNDVKVNLADNENPHSLIIGRTGSGKTTFVLNILKQLQYKNDKNISLENGKKLTREQIKDKKINYEIWDTVKGLDFKENGYKITVNNDEQLIERIFRLKEYVINVNNDKNYKNGELVIIWDEFISSIDSCVNYIKNNYDKEEKNEYVNNLKSAINLILKSGRSAGVHLVFCTQAINKTDSNLDGLDIVASISQLFILSVVAHVEEYIKQKFTLEDLKNERLSHLAKGELYYKNISKDSQKIWWNIIDDIVKNNEDNEEEVEDFEEKKEIIVNKNMIYKPENIENVE